MILLMRRISVLVVLERLQLGFANFLNNVGKMLVKHGDMLDDAN